MDTQSAMLRDQDCLGSDCSHDAADESRPAPLVAFSCGSYGAARADGSEYSGSFTDDVTDEQLLHFHQRRLEVKLATHLVLV